jgi:hypothetical protein
MRVGLLALVVLVWAACSKEPRGAASTPPAPPDAGTDACVAECVKKNQMRATSPEQIERDCRAECTGTPP